MSQTQRDVLTVLLDEFRTKFGTEHWAGALAWDTSDDGSVDRIEVNDAGIVGPLCEQLSVFKSLRKLTFALDASKIQMERVCAVESLRILQIYHYSTESSYAQHAIPVSLKPLKNLEYLLLDRVAMTGNIAELLELNNLKEFTLTNGELTVIPPVVFKMKALTSLDLGNNKISGPIPASISALTSLKTLQLSYNQLTSGLEHLAVLPELANLHLGVNKFSGSIPSELEQLRKLKYLVLTNNHCCGVVPAWLGRLELLYHLDLSENRLTDVEPGALGGPLISEINLARNKLTAFPSLQRSTRTAPIHAYFIDVSGNRIPSGPIPLSYVTEITFDKVLLGSEHILQGFSLGLNGGETYFLEKASDFICAGDGLKIVDFSQWSPTAFGLEYQEELFDESTGVIATAVLIYPQLLIKYPKQTMKRIKGPVTLANKIFPALRVFLRKLCEAQNPCVLNALCRLWYAFTYAAKKHRAEEDEMLSYADELAAIVSQLFKCNALDDTSTFYRLVLPKQYWLIKNTDSSEVDNMNEKVWSVMHVFEEQCPIRLCMDCEFKQVLSSPAVSTIMEYLFYGSIDFAGKVFVDERSPGKNAENPFEFSNFNDIDATYKGMSCPRYTPAVLFLLEGLGKAVVLLLVASVTIGVYGRDGRTAFANSTAEGFLLLMLFTQIAYELGQLSTVKWSLKKHLSDIWNALDTIALMLISAWAFLCFFPRQFDVGRTLLSLSAIPLSLQMLQYISLVKAIGLLVLMIKSMIVDVMVFVLVYVVSIFGFGVCFYGLFYGDSPFDSSGATLLYLFQSTLGNFDFGAMSGSTYNGIGTVVLVAFLVLTSVLLVNLLIAQMSSTYSRIKDKSREEWSFIMASYVQEYILLRERTPLCLLPPPFNAITTLLAPVHYWALPKYKISIAGTVADYVLGMVLVPFRLVYLVVGLTWQVVFGDMEMEGWGEALLLFLLVLGMPLYMSVSAVVRIFFVTVHVVPDGGDTNQYNIWYYVGLQQEEYKKANPLPEGTDKANRASKDSDDDDVRESGAGVELKTVKSFDSASGETVKNVLLLDATAASTAVTSPTTPAEPSSPGTEAGAANRDSVASETGTDKPVVFFSEDDIHRMFPADLHHHARRKADEDDAGPIGATAVSGETNDVLSELIAQNERLKGDLAEVKAVQAEMMALMKTLAKK